MSANLVALLPIAIEGGPTSDAVKMPMRHTCLHCHDYVSDEIMDRVS